MRSHRWRGVQSGLPESAHGFPELVKHALLVEANGMCPKGPPGGKTLDLVSWRMVLHAEGLKALWPWESGEAQLKALRPR